MDLTTATPAQIDAALASLHLAASRAIASADAAALHYGRLQSGRYFATEAQLKNAADRVAAERASLVVIRDEMAPLNAEFARRGGWTRAFIVAGGHVHNSMDCSTCNNGRQATQFGWLTDLSGHYEAEIVEAAGERACTVCYPTAPVEALARPSRLFHADEQAKADAAAKRAARSAEIAAKKAANAIRPVRGSYGMIETLTAAKQELTSAAEWNRDGYVHPSFPVEFVLDLVAAVAEKTGESPEDIIAAAVKRAAKRR